MMLPEDRPQKLIAKLFRARLEGKTSSLHPAAQALLVYTLTADQFSGQQRQACTAIEVRRKRGLVSFKRINQ